MKEPGIETTWSEPLSLQAVEGATHMKVCLAMQTAHCRALAELHNQIRPCLVLLCVKMHSAAVKLRRKFNGFMP